jgi:hypothetical protein
MGVLLHLDHVLWRAAAHLILISLITTPKTAKSQGRPRRIGGKRPRAAFFRGLLSFCGAHVSAVLGDTIELEEPVERGRAWSSPGRSGDKFGGFFPVSGAFGAADRRQKTL